MVCSLTPVQPPAYTARVHDPDGGYGDGWGWACVVEIRGDTAHLSGAERAPKPSETRALRQALRAIGVRRMEWERRNVPLARKTGLDL